MKETYKTSAGVETLHDLAALADYSLMERLSADPEATSDGMDHAGILSPSTLHRLKGPSISLTVRTSFVNSDLATLWLHQRIL